MKSLATLIKLQKTRVDEQRLLLAKMQEHLATINDAILELKKQQIEQQNLLHKDPSMGLTYGEYLKKAFKKAEDLEKKRKTAEYAVHLALEKLAEVFEEQKRYEIAEKNRQEEEEREELHRETQTLDEVGSVGFIRNKRKK